MDWASKTFNLIDEYKKRRILWNSRDSCYKMHTMREETWAELGGVFGTTAVEVKRKMNSLLASYRRERMKIKNIGTGVENKKHSKWFAYHKFQFLDQMNKAIRVRNGQDIAEDEEEEENQEEDHQQQHQEESLDELMEIRIEESSDDIQISEAKPKYNNHNSNKKSSLTNGKRKCEGGDEAGGASVRDILDVLRQQSVCAGAKRDELDVYGEYIAYEIRKLSGSAQCKVKHLINNVIYEAQTNEENTRREFPSNCVAEN